MQVTGRVVAVTGGGSGIGAALAREAASRGAAAVAVIDIDIEAAGDVAKDLIVASGVAANAYHCDIADIDEIEQTAADVANDLGVPALVCANAGVSTGTTALLDEAPDILDWVLAVNVVGTWATLRAFGRSMVAVPDPGWMLVTASEHALGVPFPGTGCYTMSKHAILGMADVLRSELPDHVGISALLPGLVATDLSRSAERRHDRFGGPGVVDDDARALLSHGMAPEVVAAAALDGVAGEQFLIATHAHAVRYAQQRSDDIDDAFTALAATEIPADSYDVMEVLARITK
jgi:NAD(P)-dependent dehydrogenase (short-subunit alcohol dehydrogenase family)